MVFEVITFSAVYYFGMIVQTVKRGLCASTEENSRDLWTN